MLNKSKLRNFAISNVNVFALLDEKTGLAKELGEVNKNLQKMQ